jgi:drug/metabolite transporter (DMT)-like permease
MDNLSEKHSTATENFMQAMSEQLEQIQVSRLQELTTDIKRLQTDKIRLQQEVDQIIAQKELIQAQQQQLITNWAQNIAMQLEQELLLQLSENLRNSLLSSTEIMQYGDNAQKLLTSYDQTLHTAFNSLQQDLYSYQNALSQQLSDMHNLEQQGEAIIEALVERMKNVTLPKYANNSLQSPLNYQSNNQYQEIPSINVDNDFYIAGETKINNNGNGTVIALDNQITNPQYLENDINPHNQDNYQNYNFNYKRETLPEIQPKSEDIPSDIPEAKSALKIPEKRRKVSEQVTQNPLVNKLQLFLKNGENKIGFVLMTLAIVALGLHDIGISILATKSNFLGIIPLGGFIKMILGNSLLILWLRMIVVLPLLSLICTLIYPQIWRDINKFLFEQDRSLGISILKAVTSSPVISGIFLFISQFLLYLSFGQINNPGIGVTILFMYPLITIPLLWLFYRQKPTLLAWGVIVNIILGVALAISPVLLGANNISNLGIISAIGAGFSFAIYIIYPQPINKISTISINLIQFITVFVSTSFALMLPLPPALSPQVLSNNWLGLITGILVLGILAVISFVFSHFGKTLLGVGKSSLIYATYPAATAILAYLVIPGKSTFLTIFQILGVALVTFAVTAMNFERMIETNKS